jgi:hypothetical protein
MFLKGLMNRRATIPVKDENLYFRARSVGGCRSAAPILAPLSAPKKTKVLILYKYNTSAWIFATAIKKALVLLLFLTLWDIGSTAHAYDVLWVDEPGESLMNAPLKMAIGFYGFEAKKFEVEESPAKNQLRVSSEEILAVVIDARALPSVSLETLCSSLSRKIPVLVFGVHPKTARATLDEWSKGLIIGADLLSDPRLSVRVADARWIAGSLSGQQVPLGNAQSSFLMVDSIGQYQPILRIGGESQTNPPVVMAMTEVEGRAIFFLGNIEAENPCSIGEALPFLLFLRYAGGDRCWHSDGQYANFTIDDPWLIEPYGFLNYQGLLKEMEKENFHTTIAFIPWNYDRSHEEVIDIFRSHPDHYSLCIHGNDHDHQEFYPEDDQRKQQRKIEQALARMEEFRKRTGLPYDRVMVFPHGMAPEKTLRLLPKYNFLATINATPISLLSEGFVGTKNGIRPPVNQGQNILSLWRYAPYGRGYWEIALDLFLGNPVLFYAHHDFFATGIESFTPVARQVNQIQPGIEWCSLGHVVEHLFLQRRKDDDSWEIRAFSNRFILRNTDRVNSTFHIRKAESSSIPIGRVTVDGAEMEHGVGRGEVSLALRIPPGESRCVQIEYANEGAWQAVEPQRSSWRVDILRYVSDFRDLWLSRIPFGTRLVRTYYKGETQIFLIFFLLPLVAAIGLGLGLRKRRQILRRFWNGTGKRV